MQTNVDKSEDKSGQMQTNVNKCRQMWMDIDRQTWTDVDKRGQQGQTWTNTHVCSLCPCPVPNGKWC